MNARRQDDAPGTLTLVFDGTATPAKTALFLLLCAAWILPGLIGHDPWKPDEAIHFGAVRAVLGGEWLYPTVAGHAYVGEAPLYYWLAAVVGWLTTPALPFHDGVRLTSGLAMVMALVALARAAVAWYGERGGRLAVILCIGCLGLLQRAHEINPDTLGLAGYALGLYALAVMRQHPKRATAALAGAIAICGLATGWLLAACVALTAAASLYWLPGWQRKEGASVIAIGTAVGAAITALWPLALWQAGIPSDAWLGAASGIRWLKSGGSEWTYFVRVLVWFTLPAWPLALIAVLRRRRELSYESSIGVPFAALAVLLVMLTLLAQTRDIDAMPLALPMALLGIAFIDRTPRGFASFIDAFGIVLFLGLVLLIWSGWLGVTTGIPTGAARWVPRQIPGYEHVISWPNVALALALSVLWLVIALRTRRSNRRAIVNWTAGLTTTWLVANLLGLPAIDYARSYRGVVAQVNQHLNDGCVVEVGITPSQRVLFDYFASIRFVSGASNESAQCKALLVVGSQQDDFRPSSPWRRVWEGARPGDKSELLRLYRRD